MFYIEFEDNHVIDSREALCGNVFHKWETLGNKLCLWKSYLMLGTQRKKRKVDFAFVAAR